jgi:hypothetical protein
MSTFCKKIVYITRDVSMVIQTTAGDKDISLDTNMNSARDVSLQFK